VLAAVYLNEYATENWFTRIVNLAVVNLAGVPSIVHGLFGVGAFDPATFVAVPVLLFAVAAVAAWLPARRVSRVAPTEALRSEG